MYATIQKWGNSQGLRIPKPLLAALGLGENDRVELTQTADTITIRKAPTTSHRTLEERLDRFLRKTCLGDRPHGAGAGDRLGQGLEGHEVW